MIRTLALAGLSAIVLSGCIYIRADGEHIDTNWGGRDAIYGSKVTASNTVVITAASNGCTGKEDFNVEVDRDDGRYELTFKRLREDNCRAFIREGVELVWSYSELGIPPDGNVVVEHYSRR